jgi:coronin-1B/1C/6
MTGSDNQVVIWNVGTGEPLVEMDCHPDLVYSACWNWDGSQLVTTCRDKKIRIINPRTGEIISVSDKLIKLIWISFTRRK